MGDKYWLTNKCKCGKKICYQSKKCASCAAKDRKITEEGRKKLSISRMGNNNSAYIDGRSLKKYMCIDCKIKEITWYTYWNGSKRCRSCACKEKYKNPKNHPNYKNGISLKTNKCQDCGKELSDYRAKRCYDCDVTRRINSKEGVFGINRKTLPEIKLEIILKKLKFNFKYVGNGKIWIEGFNPDFVDKKNRKIIELYGDYWHNRPESIKKDKGRVACYLKNKYKLLIIWEHELEKTNRLIKKLRKF